MNYLKKLKSIAKDNQIYIVGGTIRDYILDKSINDVDMIVFNDIKNVVYKFAEEINRKIVVLDKNRNIFRVVINENLFLDFSSPVGQDLFEDLGYRDFTINSMAVSLDKVELYDDQINIGKKDIVDPFNGKQDIKNKIIKVVNKKSIENDPLRIIRAFRFANNLDFEINSETKRIIENNINLLKRIKVERIKEELIKFFSYKLKITVIKDFLNTSIISQLFNFEYKKNIDNKNIIKTISCLKKINYFKKTNNKKYIFVLIVIFIELIQSTNLDLKVIKDILITYTFNKNDVIIIRDYLHIIINLMENHHNYINDDELIYEKMFYDQIDYLNIKFIINCYFNESNDIDNINEIIEQLIIMKNRIEYKIINGDTIMNILNIKSSERVGEVLKAVKKKRALGILNSRKEIIDYIENLSKNKNIQ